MSAAPIAIFDSGLGGLTVQAELRRALPGEALVYLGDTARNPYGSKSGDLVRDVALQNLRFLLKFDPKLIVVACNTATAMALEALRAASPVPVIGVIEPGARSAVAQTRTRRVGIIGTAGTVGSDVYTRHIHAIAPDITAYSRACPLFVSLVEEGRSADDAIVFSIVKDYLTYFLDKNIDALVLGCTHYPLLKKPIGRFLGGRVAIVDSAVETTATVQRFLAEQGRLTEGNAGACRYFATDNPEHFEKAAGRFLGADICGVEFVDVAEFYR